MNELCLRGFDVRMSLMVLLVLGYLFCRMLHVGYSLLRAAEQHDCTRHYEGGGRHLPEKLGFVEIRCCVEICILPAKRAQSGQRPPSWFCNALMPRRRRPQLETTHCINRSEKWGTCHSMRTNVAQWKVSRCHQQPFSVVMRTSMTETWRDSLLHLVIVPISLCNRVEEDLDGGDDVGISPGSYR